MIWSFAFWKGAAERAIKTAAQVLAAVFVVGVPILDVDIVGALGLVATAVVASLLTSILSADFVAGLPPVLRTVGGIVPFASDRLPTSIGTTGPTPVTRISPDEAVRLGLRPADPVDPGDHLSEDPRAAARAAKIARARGDG